MKTSYRMTRLVMEEEDMPDLRAIPDLITQGDWICFLGQGLASGAFSDLGAMASS